MKTTRTASRTFAILALLAGAAAAVRAEGGKTFDAAVGRDFPGWELSASASGDLNGDGVEDRALILFKEGRGEEKGRALLVVYLSSASGAPALFAKAEKAVCVGCGGPKAAVDRPLGELSSKKGILRVVYAGGSREAFTDETKWRLDRARGAFVLIGEAYTVTDTVGEEPTTVLDVNFSARKMTNRSGRKTRACEVPAEFAGVELKDFDYEGRHEDDREKLSAACPLK